MKVGLKGAALLLTLFIALFLTACAGSESDSTESRPAQGGSTTAPSATATVADVSEDAGLQLVGNTGRPQFLNSYARW